MSVLDVFFAVSVAAALTMAIRDLLRGLALLSGAPGEREGVR